MTRYNIIDLLTMAYSYDLCWSLQCAHKRVKIGPPPCCSSGAAKSNLYHLLIANSPLTHKTVILFTNSKCC